MRQRSKPSGGVSVWATLWLVACGAPERSAPTNDTSGVLATVTVAPTAIPRPLAPTSTSSTSSAEVFSPPPTCTEAPRCTGERELETCQQGQRLRVRCEIACQPLPAPREARCASDVTAPPSVVSLLSAKPYVEDKCAADTKDPASLRCRYQSMGIDAEVVTRTPEPLRVATWLAEAFSFAEPLEGLAQRDPAAREAILLVAARQVRNQSSRIFPMSGVIVEDLGNGPTAFSFDRGVVSPCPAGGCACRINSLRPRAYCRFAAATSDESEAACTLRLADSAGDSSWRDHCSETHLLALKGAAHPHFRAKFFELGQKLQASCADCSDALLRQKAEKLLGGGR